MPSVQQFVPGVGPVLPQDRVSGILNWGNSAIGLTTVERFPDPFSDGVLAPVVEIFFVMPRDSTLRNLFVRNRIAGAGGSTITYTLRVNGVNTLLLVTLATTALQGSNTIDFIDTLQGDLISVSCNKALAITTSPSDIQITLEAA